MYNQHSHHLCGQSRSQRWKGVDKVTQDRRHDFFQTECCVERIKLHCKESLLGCWKLSLSHSHKQDFTIVTAVCLSYEYSTLCGCGYLVSWPAEWISCKRFIGLLWLMNPYRSFAVFVCHTCEWNHLLCNCTTCMTGGCKLEYLKKIPLTTSL